MELIILTVTIVLLYAFLRSFGGKGISIRGQFAPASTLQGKRDRMIGLVLVLMIIVATANMFISEEWADHRLTVVVPFLIGMSTSIFYYLKKK